MVPWVVPQLGAIINSPLKNGDLVAQVIPLVSDRFQAKLLSAPLNHLSIRWKTVHLSSSRSESRHVCFLFFMENEV